MSRRKEAKRKAAEYEDGSRKEQDARERTLLARERTFAAWMRTAFAIMAAGFLLEKHWSSLGIEWLASTAGAALVAVGALIQLFGYRAFRRTIRNLEEKGRYRHPHLLFLTITIVIVVLAALAGATFFLVG